MSANLPPLFNPQFLADDGTLAAGYLLYTFASGTTTSQTTYSDQAMTSANTNPVELDSVGRCALWLDPTLEYTLVLKTAAGATVKTWDGVTGCAPSTTALTSGDLSGLDASDIAFTTGTATTWFAGTNVADALDDIIAEVDALPASQVTVADAGAHYTGTNVEAVLAEIATSLGGTFSLPSQTGNSGKYLTTDGSATSWGAPLPSQTSNSGKFLTTDGTNASWGTLAAVSGTLGTTGSVTITGGLVLKWGQTGAMADASSASVTFGTAFPTACYGVQLTSVNTAGDANAVASVSASGFTAYIATAGSIYWFAYGS